MTRIRQYKGIVPTSIDSSVKIGAYSNWPRAPAPPAPAGPPAVLVRTDVVIPPA